jgi:Bestrophin, RFP-TM, chloride channel
MSIKTAASSTADVVADVVVGGRVPTFNELKGIEKKRREILKRSSLPLLRILFFWDGTCNSILFQDPLFWITLTLYMAVRLQARVMKIENISNSDIGIIGGFLSFFLVFFVIQSNTRFNLMYEKSMSCEGRIFDVATMAKASLPREHGLRLVRYMNAAVSGHWAERDIDTIAPLNHVFATSMPLTMNHFNHTNPF